MTEYAFDVKLFAVVRVNAISEAEARTILRDRLNCAVINVQTSGGYNELIIGEASMDGEADLFEIDGEEVT